MAEMIPDRLPQGASAGEKRVFDALQRLPDDCVVYYEPVVRARYPDFVVIMPDVGLLVIEVKGWYPNYIQRADLNEIAIKAPNQAQTVERHPLKQAREYMFALMDVARRHPASARLIHADGQQAGRFVFPFGTLAVLNNITRDQLHTAYGEAANAVFPQPRVMTRDELLLLESSDPADLRERLRRCFDPWWTFTPLTDHQMAAVRAIIHPEIIIPPKHDTIETGAESLFVLDYRQERFARSIGDGHRVLYGVAGSGKTVILLSRARVVAEDPSKRILLLCYNKSLASYFRSALADIPQVTALHFHGWGSQSKVSFDPDEEEEGYGLRFLKRLQDGGGDGGSYDAVLIDESQDFARSWFECAKAALKDPIDGDLVIVGDGNQSLYRRRKFTWRDAGIEAIGRTINLAFDLNRNYRNTREILKWALPFATNRTSQTEDSSLLSVPIDPNTALRNGLPPRLIKCADRKEECAWVTKEIRDWISNGIPTLSGERERVQPSQIGILYPALRRQDRSNMNDFLDDLRTIAPVVWFNQPGGADIGRPGIKVQTILSSKGLQYKAVIVIWTDLLPFNDDPEQIALDRGQLYVAMTRAEDLLTVACSSSSAFTEELERTLQT